MNDLLLRRFVTQSNFPQCEAVLNTRIYANLQRNIDNGAANDF